MTGRGKEGGVPLTRWLISPTHGRSRQRGGKVMMEKGKVYVCEPCGLEVEIRREGSGTLICCGMEMMEESPAEEEIEGSD